MRIATLIVPIVVLVAGSAKAAPDRAEQFFVAPGKYVLYDCAQLSRAEAGFAARDKELSRLIARAKEGPAGGLISTLVYDPDYYSNLGELHDVQREKAAKNCGPGQKPPARPASRPTR